VSLEQAMLLDRIYHLLPGDFDSITTDVDQTSGIVCS
jgi:hypothetical protein